MQNFAIGISYGLASAGLAWSISLVIRSIYRVFHTI